MTTHLVCLDDLDDQIANRVPQVLITGKVDEEVQGLRSSKV